LAVGLSLPEIIDSIAIVAESVKPCNSNNGSGHRKSYLSQQQRSGLQNGCVFRYCCHYIYAFLRGPVLVSHLYRFEGAVVYQKRNANGNAVVSSSLLLGVACVASSNVPICLKALLCVFFFYAHIP
jgi:hypothetical protein